MSLLSRSSDTFYAFRALRLLTTPWEKTGAFKAGIVDADGKLLRKAETSEDKNVYNLFHRLIFNLKRLLNKIPLGKSTISSYLAGLYLIREHTGMSEEELLSVISEATAIDIDIPLLEDSVKLSPGVYYLERDMTVPKTGELQALAKTLVIVENASPVGTIFGANVYEAFHEDTQSKLFITINDISL